MANTAFETGSDVQISVNAADPDGSVSNVKISINDTEKATLQSSPYNYTWNTSGVAPGQYLIKAIATDNGGLTAMAQVIVTIAGRLAQVTTADITEITAFSAKGGGEVTDDGGSTVSYRGLVWSTSSGVTHSNKLGHTEDGTGKGSFVSEITGLEANTTYYVKAYAQNGQGISYGDERSFKTIALATVVLSTISYTDITSNSATVSGEITDDGGSAVTERGFLWKLGSNQPTIDDYNGKVSVGSGTGVYSYNIDGLTNYTDYYIRAYATTASGTSYSVTNHFKTNPGKPIVQTLEITQISAHWAVSGGLVTDDGGLGDIYNLATGIVWSTYPNPDYWMNEGIVYRMEMDDHAYTSILSGLEPNTMYYLRAFTTYDGDYYAYGDIKTFTTPPFTVQTGEFTDTRDDAVYPTITINNQTWMAKNLAYLPEVCPASSNCGYWVYDYQGTDVAVAKATSNYSTYGVLYNFSIANDVCPVGWHLPDWEDWSYLKLNLGMEYNSGWGTNEGGKMKEAGTSHWMDPNYGATNSSKFTALPAGMRDHYDKTFKEIGTHTKFWEQGSGSARWHELDYLNEVIITSGVYLTQDILGYGFSVRCIKD